MTHEGLGVGGLYIIIQAVSKLFNGMLVVALSMGS